VKLEQYEDAIREFSRLEGVKKDASFRIPYLKESPGIYEDGKLTSIKNVSLKS